MRLLWQERCNPLAWWWAALAIASCINIALWFAIYGEVQRSNRPGDTGNTELMVFLCAAYVFGCAFRSFLPRADVQRICLFDTWLSSVIVGRSVATVAEVSFAAQWAIALNAFGRVGGVDVIANAAWGIVPLIVVAQCCSWYGVLTTNSLAHAIENSIWAITFLAVGAALCCLLPEFQGLVRVGLGMAILGIAAYLAFLTTVDVPMYLSRWYGGNADEKGMLGPLEGLRDASTRWIVTHDYAQWKDEIAWMSLYFTAAVWASLALCLIHEHSDRLPDYRSNRPAIQTAAGVSDADDTGPRAHTKPAFARPR